MMFHQLRCSSVADFIPIVYNGTRQSLCAFQHLLDVLIQVRFYIPVYFPESPGCRDLKPVRSDLHPYGSRIQPTFSLCALPIERTAFSATPSAPVFSLRHKDLDYIH